MGLRITLKQGVFFFFFRSYLSDSDVQWRLKTTGLQITHLVMSSIFEATTVGPSPIAPPKTPNLCFLGKPLLPSILPPWTCPQVQIMVVPRGLGFWSLRIRPSEAASPRLRFPMRVQPPSFHLWFLVRSKCLMAVRRTKERTNEWSGASRYLIAHNSLMFLIYRVYRL